MSGPEAQPIPATVVSPAASNAANRTAIEQANALQAEIAELEKAVAAEENASSDVARRLRNAAAAIWNLLTNRGEVRSQVEILGPREELQGVFESGVLDDNQQARAQILEVLTASTGEFAENVTNQLAIADNLLAQRAYHDAHTARLNAEVGARNQALSALPDAVQA